ncbi:hypothetical protein EDB86DRAFT_1759074 [Lactarius hatsudake]|nr:hypothetical protein EDB86DRAFT_1759074 [Lactarius hatsudake]
MCRTLDATSSPPYCMHRLGSEDRAEDRLLGSPLLSGSLTRFSTYYYVNSKRILSDSGLTNPKISRAHITKRLDTAHLPTLSPRPNGYYQCRALCTSSMTNGERLQSIADAANEERGEAVSGKVVLCTGIGATPCKIRMCTQQRGAGLLTHHILPSLSDPGASTLTTSYLARSHGSNELNLFFTDKFLHDLCASKLDHSHEVGHALD